MLYSTKIEWTREFSQEKYIAILLPFLFYAKILVSYSESRFQMWLLLAGVVMFYFICRYLGETIQVSAEGLSFFSSLRNGTIIWEQVEEVRLGKFLGIPLSSLVLHLREPVRLARFGTKVRKCSLYLSSVSSREVCQVLRQYLPATHFDEKDLALLESPPSRALRYWLLGLRIAIALLWGSMIFFKPTFQEMYFFMFRFLALGLALAGVEVLHIFFIERYKPENKWMNARDALMKSSLPVLLLFSLGFLNETSLLISLYAYLWFLFGLAAFEALQTLFSERNSSVPYLGFLLILGFLLYPGPEILWETRQFRTLSWSTPYSSESGGSQDILVWPDGRLAAYDLNAEGAEAIFSFIDSNFSIESTTTSAQGIPYAVYGEWIAIIAHISKEERRFVLQKYGRAGASSEITDMHEIITPATPNHASEYLFAYTADASAKDEIELFRVNIETGRSERLFYISGYLQAVQKGDNHVVWAQRKDAWVLLYQWRESDGIRPLGSAIALQSDLFQFSHDLMYLALPAKNSEKHFDIVRIGDGHTWTLPEQIPERSLYNLVWSFPYVACFSSQMEAFRLFKLGPNREVSEIPLPRREHIDRIDFSPDARYAILYEDNLLNSRQSLYHLKTGHQRTLHLNQGFISSAHHRHQSLWSKDAFHYATLSGFSRQGWKYWNLHKLTVPLDE